MANSVDISIVHAWKGDTDGNLVYRKTACSFNTMMATGWLLPIAEIEHLVEAGSIHPDCIHAPDIFVKRVVRDQTFERERSGFRIPRRHVADVIPAGPDRPSRANSR